MKHLVLSLKWLWELDGTPVSLIGLDFLHRKGIEDIILRKETVNPLTADCAELLVFSFIHLKGVLYEILLQCFLFAFQWIPLQNSKQTKKVHQKIFTRTNFMQISPQVVP